jgi:hypothetical protein
MRVLSGWLVCLSALASACAPAGARAGGVLDDETGELRIAVALLRSQAAELSLLQQLAQRGDLPPRYVRAHASQLEKAVQRAREQLSDAPTPPSARPQAEIASAAAGELNQEVSRLRSGAWPPERDSGAPLQARLQQAERALPPAP